MPLRDWPDFRIWLWFSVGLVLFLHWLNIFSLEELDCLSSVGSCKVVWNCLWSENYQCGHKMHVGSDGISHNKVHWNYIYNHLLIPAGKWYPILSCNFTIICACIVWSCLYFTFRINLWIVAWDDIKSSKPFVSIGCDNMEIRLFSAW